MSKTKAERRAERRAKRRAVVLYREKPIATTQLSAHIPSPAEAEMLAFKAPIEYETHAITTLKPVANMAEKPREEITRSGLYRNGLATV